MVPGDFNRSRSLATSISLEDHVQIGSLTAAKPLVSPQVSENLNQNGKKLRDNHRKPARPKGIPKVFERFSCPEIEETHGFTDGFTAQGTPSAGRRLPQQSEVFSSPRAESQSLEANCTTSDSLSGMPRQVAGDRKIMVEVNVCHHGLRIYVNICDDL